MCPVDFLPESVRRPFCNDPSEVATWHSGSLLTRINSCYQWYCWDERPSRVFSQGNGSGAEWLREGLSQDDRSCSETLSGKGMRLRYGRFEAGLLSVDLGTFERSISDNSASNIYLTS
jgi:hypothetical protein